MRCLSEYKNISEISPEGLGDILLGLKVWDKIFELSLIKEIVAVTSFLRDNRD